MLNKELMSLYDDNRLAMLLCSMEGNAWKKNNMRRVYYSLDKLCNLIGFEFSTYKTGNISCAYIDGEKISNTRAKDIYYTLLNMKIYFDFTDYEFHCKNNNSNLSEVILSGLEEELNQKMEEYKTAVTSS